MVDEASFKKIYDTKYGWIGRIGGEEYEAFYFITVSQRVVSSKIGIGLSKLEVAKIIESNGDLRTIDSILREREKDGHINIE